MTTEVRALTIALASRAVGYMVLKFIITSPLITIMPMNIIAVVMRSACCRLCAARAATGLALIDAA